MGACALQTGALKAALNVIHGELARLRALRAKCAEEDGDLQRKYQQIMEFQTTEMALNALVSRLLAENGYVTEAWGFAKKNLQVRARGNACPVGGSAACIYEHRSF